MFRREDSVVGVGANLTVAVLLPVLPVSLSSSLLLRREDDDMLGEDDIFLTSIVVSSRLSAGFLGFSMDGCQIVTVKC
ncbi:hypothetical protein E2562_006748 [Oryza meyeriana var. granulata]|uniref:Uncharacterized protein n=1 Tax=Oryza meyeriana var. granulata TaxID=110450 RepID=A0A6G1EHB2_9ORYZ|nr:hypothetical protein E2562_006748 [Oryza meyeriana var. granulata]